MELSNSLDNHGIKSLSKERRKILEAYQQLFYLLQVRAASLPQPGHMRPQEPMCPAYLLCTTCSQANLISYCIPGLEHVSTQGIPRLQSETWVQLGNAQSLASEPCWGDGTGALHAAHTRAAGDGNPARVAHGLRAPVQPAGALVLVGGQYRTQGIHLPSDSGSVVGPEVGDSGPSSSDRHGCRSRDMGEHGQEAGSSWGRPGKGYFPASRGCFPA